MKMILSLLMAFGLFLTTSISAVAHEYRLGDILIEHPYAFATPVGAPAGAGYLVLKNTGEVDDRLISASVPFVKRVELHEMILDDDIMRMREKEGGIPIPAGETVTLERGGLHIMFMGLTDQLTEGERHTLSLTFEKAGTIEVELVVEPMSMRSQHNH